jgi:hypothetical protein
MWKYRFARLITVMTLVILTIAFSVACQLLPTSQGKGQRPDLSFLKSGISYDEIVAQIGEADRNIGSGINIFQYDFPDGSVLTLQFVHLDHLDRASIRETDGTLKMLVP